MATVVTMSNRFDPKSVIGKRVRFEILLDWDLVLPTGVVTGIMQSNPAHRSLYYLVELDSVLTFEPHRTGLLLRRRPNVSVKRVVLAMRRPDEIEQELQGKVSSELTAPLLYYPVEKRLSGQPISEESLEAIGPVRVHILQEKATYLIRQDLQSLGHSNG